MKVLFSGVANVGGGGLEIKGQKKTRPYLKLWAIEVVWYTTGGHAYLAQSKNSIMGIEIVTIFMNYV